MGHQLQLFLDHVYHSRRNPVLFSYCSPTLPFLLPLIIRNDLSTTDLSVLDTSYKWNHEMCDLFFVYVVLWFELMVSCLLGQTPYHLSHSASPCVIFCDCFLSPSIMLARFTQIIACISISFLFIAE
jgi:hypothetical protein